MLSSSLLACRRALAGALLAAAALIACAETPVAPEAATAEPYRIQPGDVLIISVWKEPELQAEVTVRLDGAVSFPLAGDVPAAGGTLAALRTAIDDRLRRYIPSPVVSISVKASTGSRVYVVGKVNRPGEFLLTRPLDVMQALALAGGTSPFADLGDIRILRRIGDEQVVLRFRYGDVERGRALDGNILLQSGDTVVVP